MQGSADSTCITACHRRDEAKCRRPMARWIWSLETTNLPSNATQGKTKQKQVVHLLPAPFLYHLQLASPAGEFPVRSGTTGEETWRWRARRVESRGESTNYSWFGYQFQRKYLITGSAVRCLVLWFSLHFWTPLESSSIWIYLDPYKKHELGTFNLGHASTHPIVVVCYWNCLLIARHNYSLLKPT